MSSIEHPAIGATIDELVKRSFFKRSDDGRLELLPKCAEPRHVLEFGRILQQLAEDVQRAIH
jgi:hypothetical protein